MGLTFYPTPLWKTFYLSTTGTTRTPEYQRRELMSEKPIDIRTVNVTRYVTPLREGGSLPAIIEADDGFLHVLKF